MPELNKAALIRGGIIFLQYLFLVLIYYFIYRIGKILFLDMRSAQQCKMCVPVEPQVSLDVNAYMTVLEAGETSGLSAGERIVIQPTTTLGRNSNLNTVIIHDTFVSAEHALIQLYKDCYWISDLSSTNGTFVNDERIEDETPLTVGAKIKIGSVVLRFEG